MTLTWEEKRTVRAVFGEMLRKPYGELNSYLGSVTIKEMQRLYNKLSYEDYCEERGIRYEDMTEDDFIDAHMRENEC